MTDNQKEALEKILDYLEYDESKEFEASGKPSGHIYEAISVVRAGMEM